MSINPLDLLGSTPDPNPGPNPLTYLGPNFAPAPEVASDAHPSTAGTTPAPPLTGLPVDRSAPGTYGDREPWQESTSDRAEGLDAIGPQIVTPTVPLIGAIPFGGLLYSAGRNLMNSGDVVTLGDRGNNSPRMTAIAIWTNDGIGSFELLGDIAGASQPGQGALAPIGNPGTIALPPFILNVRRLNVRCLAAARTLHWFVIGYEW